MTFSIVARDPATGAFGVATATGSPAVGSLVPHARAGAGAIATQGYTTNPFYASAGLEELATGKSAQMLCDELVAADRGSARRQCLIIDNEGRTAAWTGAECSAFAGSVLKQDAGVAGNMLNGPDVLDAMISAYLEEDLPFEDRLIAALAAGNGTGGDVRGTCSSAVKIYTSETYPAVDFRVDLSERPIEDLAKVLAASRDDDIKDFRNRLPTKANPSRC